ncbi:PepSY domain-containing protein [Gottfriedia luciferensis]|uniref:PepSY domain-containing protein n=1 Tax=Gottfriedia luciferensis TaxID=178774 RepID=UPI000B451EC2|nr:PepSY domain-containing protein [Gottfriedia luciferensis]
MKKVRVIHFWIGVIVSIFLLIESTTGIIMYFDKGGDRPDFSMNNQFPSGQMNGSQQSNNQSGGENSSIQNGQSNENFQPSFQNGNPNFDNRREQSAFSVKSLHTGIIGLISGIGLFILTGTGLILSWILWRNKRKNKKRKDKVAMAI